MIAQSWEWHSLPPAALGARASKLTNKTAALLHSLRLESRGREHLENICSRVVAFTTDLGTEMGLAEALRGSTILGWTHPDLQTHEVERADDHHDAPSRGGSSPFVFPHALPVPGVLHILDNCTHQSLDEGFQHWPVYVKQLQSICAILTQKWERDVLLQDMVQKGATQAEQNLLNREFPTIVSWRWGSLHHVLEALLPLRPILVQYFSTSAFLQSKNGVDAAAVHFALRSPLFWCYTKMLFVMQDKLRELQCWAERCPCHDIGGDHNDREDQEERHRKMFARLCGTMKCMHTTCPMRGKRSAEMATGDLLELLRSLVATQTTVITTVLSDALQPQETELIITDFKAGMEWARLILELKLCHWQELPWKLCGLAHFNEGKARDCAREVLGEFASRPDTLGARHRLTQEFLGHDSPLRHDVEQLANGVRRSALPVLVERVVPLMSIPISERWVERQHSLVKGALAGKHRKHATQVSH